MQAAPAGGANAAPHDICLANYTRQVEEAWEITRSLIRQMRSEVLESGAQFAVLMIPTSPQIASPRNRASLVLRSTDRRAGPLPGR